MNYLNSVGNDFCIDVIAGMYTFQRLKENLNAADRWRRKNA